MTQHSFLPFADFFQGIIPGVERMGYEPCFKQIYQPIFMKGVKKIQSSENFFELQAPLYSQTAFKKIHSVDNFIPEDLDFDLNPLFVRDGANARITYDEVQKAKLQQASKKNPQEKPIFESNIKLKFASIGQPMDTASSVISVPSLTASKKSEKKSIFQLITRQRSVFSIMKTCTAHMDKDANSCTVPGCSPEKRVVKTDSLT